MRRPRSRIALFSLLLVAVVIFFGISYVWNSVTDIFQAANPTGLGHSVSITISKNETAAEIADDLQSKGLIRNAFAFRIWARIKGLDHNLQAGVYKKLNPGMNISDIIDQLQTATPDATRVLIKEGWRLEQIAAAFANASPKLPNFKIDDFLKFTHDVTQFPAAGNSPILKQLPPGQKSMEGLLFPSTYEIPLDADSTYVINLLLKQTNDIIQQHKLDQIAQQHQLNTYQLITLASIVERETRGDQDRPGIATVYWNRLFSDQAKSETYGLLQADPTVQYARDTQTTPTQYWLPLDGAAADIAADSPWSTFHQVGLPPTPICSPGLASLTDSANPLQKPYVYFFAGKDNVTHFEETLAQFNADTAKYGISQ